MGFQNKPFAKPSDTRVDKVDLVQVPLGPMTVATTGNTDYYYIVPRDMRVETIQIVGIALATSDTNYITFTVTNLGLAGAGSTVMLSTADTNTTKATGGSAIAIGTARSLVLTSTDASLKCLENQVLRFRAAATGTLANTVTSFAYNLELADVLVK